MPTMPPPSRARWLLPLLLSTSAVSSSSSNVFHSSEDGHVPSPSSASKNTRIIGGYEVSSELMHITCHV